MQSILGTVIPKFFSRPEKRLTTERTEITEKSTSRQPAWCIMRVAKSAFGAMFGKHRSNVDF